jgi:hypothetical protein
LAAAAAGDPGEIGAGEASVEVRRQWPELVATLRSEESGAWLELCQTLELVQVEHFGQCLATLGEKYGAVELQRYARELFEQAQAFDLERLPRTLEAFPKTIANLEAQCPSIL